MKTHDRKYQEGNGGEGGRGEGEVELDYRTQIKFAWIIKNLCLNLILSRAARIVVVPGQGGGGGGVRQ